MSPAVTPQAAGSCELSQTGRKTLMPPVKTRTPEVTIVGLCSRRSLAEVRFRDAAVPYLAGAGAGAVVPFIGGELLRVALARTRLQSRGGATGGSSTDGHDRRLARRGARPRRPSLRRPGRHSVGGRTAAERGSSDAAVAALRPLITHSFAIRSGSRRSGSDRGGRCLALPRSACFRRPTGYARPGCARAAEALSGVGRVVAAARVGAPLSRSRALPPSVPRP
jgi:hypothetical protein